MDGYQHAADLARFHQMLDERLPNPPGNRICDCGREIQDGEDHAMCWPGM